MQLLKLAANDSPLSISHQPLIFNMNCWRLMSRSLLMTCDLHCNGTCAWYAGIPFLSCSVAPLFCCLFCICFLCCMLVLCALHLCLALVSITPFYSSLSFCLSLFYEKMSMLEVLEPLRKGVGTGGWGQGDLNFPLPVPSTPGSHPLPIQWGSCLYVLLLFCKTHFSRLPLPSVSHLPSSM